MKSRRIKIGIANPIGNGNVRLVWKQIIHMNKYKPSQKNGCL